MESYSVNCVTDDELMRKRYWKVMRITWAVMLLTVSAVYLILHSQKVL